MQEVRGEREEMWEAASVHGRNSAEPYGTTGFVGTDLTHVA